MDMSNTEERRKENRIMVYTNAAIRTEVMINDFEWQEVGLNDVANSGAGVSISFIKQKNTPAVGQKIGIRFFDMLCEELKDEILTLNGSVKWIESEKSNLASLGINFDDITDNERKSLREIAKLLF